MPKASYKAFIVYEESMPLIQLVDFLTINHFAAVVSPVHDRDTYTKEDVKKWRESQELIYGVYIAEDAETWERPTGELVTGNYGQPLKKTKTEKVPQVGQLKKPHRHVYIQLDYSAPISVWLNLLAPLDIHYVEEVRSKRAYLRYLAHLDCPDKVKYNRDEIISLGGVDISCVYDKSQREVDNLEIRILNCIAQNKLHSISTLQNHLLHKEKDMEAYREVKAHYGYWSQYMRGLYFITEVKVDSDFVAKKLVVDADGVVSEDEEEKEVTPDAA